VYTLKGVHVGLKVRWQFEAPPGALDSYFASFLGTRALIELRAGTKEKFIPEVYLTPGTAEPRAAWEASLKSTVHRLQNEYPGLSYEMVGNSFRVLLPDSDRSGDSLQRLFEKFAGFVRDPKTFPEFENSSLLAKYYITTTAVSMANERR
jgi:hypothetical protein